MESYKSSNNMTIHSRSFDSMSPDVVGAVSMHSAESWHGSGRQLTCHPFSIASAVVIFACPTHLPGLSFLTGTWKRTRVPGSDTELPTTGGRGMRRWNYAAGEAIPAHFGLWLPRSELTNRLPSRTAFIAGSSS